MKPLLFSILVILSFSTVEIFAESFPEDVWEKAIKITKSPINDTIVYDGKWTYEYEWKPTSWDYVSDGYHTLNIRTAHYEQFIYVLLDYDVDDNLKHENDHAIFCIDSDNNKTLGVTGDEFCFELLMNSSTPSTYMLEINDKMITKKQIDNHSDLIGVSSLSDENDRYSKIPHPSYEFKIPIDLFGRSNNYGVFISVYDSQNNKTMNWPDNLETSQNIPSPKIWGYMISPDNSLPEFPFPLLIIAIILPITIILTRSGRFSIK